VIYRFLRDKGLLNSANKMLAFHFRKK